MPTFGYHASHEQFPPSELIRLAQRAEAAGFPAAMCSDHFHPWSDAQGQSGFAWSWLGAAMQATTLPFGVVTVPGYRYQPAILAQAAATLSEMFPDRLWVSLGSGESLNEHITGERWPSKPERNARLQECADVIRALWSGEWVNHHGLVTAEQARLYTLPATPPKIMGAAITPETAGWVGSWADGMLTVAQPRETLREVVEAFRAGGGAGKPMYLQVKVAWASTEQEARRGAHEQWRTNILTSHALADLSLPQHFSDATRYVRPEDLDEAVRISVDPGQHVQWLEEDAAMGFDHIYLHNVHPDQEGFIDAFGNRVLPHLS